MKNDPPRLRLAAGSATPLISRHSHGFTVHGVAVEDEFAWLKAANWQAVLKDPTVLPAGIRDVLDAENAYASRVLKPLGRLRKRLGAELRARIKEDDSSPPSPDGPFVYGERYRAGGQQPILWRRRRDGVRRQTLLDGDREAHGLAFFDLGDWAMSHDHRLMAWAADDAGSEFYTIRVRDIAGNRDDDRLTGCAPTAVWSHDGQHLFYVALDDKARPCRVMRHRLGTPQAEDAIVHEETTPGFFLDLDQTQDGSLGVIGISDHETSECWLFDLADATATPRCVAAREHRIEYDVDRHGGELVIRTNRDAPDFRIMLCPLDETAPAHWRDLVPHEPGRMITDVAVFDQYLVRLERENALPRLVIRNWADGTERTVEFPEEAYDLDLEPGYEYETATLRFTYSSLTTPDETYDYHMATGARVLVKRQEIPCGHDPARYVTRRISATAPDGTAVPMSLLYRRDTPLDGSAPAYLEGYGAYGHASTPYFDENNLSLVDRGFVYAIAHVRGGTECGAGWYLDGKRENKPNTFHDYIACAHGLIEHGYTHAGGIVGYGASAGGMLIGAAANLAPELFAGLIAEVPFVDVLNTMLDADLPLTPPEWPEWGNPRTDEAAFRTILGYSPYDNVSARRYPPILALGGLADPRVTYWEPLKWVARMRSRMSGGGPVVLRTNMGAGHDGASGRFDRLAEIARMHAFAIAVAAAPEAPLP